MINHKKRSSSFRDPSGFVFSHNGIIYRQINKVYKDNFDLLISSGLYEKLTSLGYLVKHEEVKSVSPQDTDGYKIIKPQAIPFISYPYEWCFSMLKDAAILTLNIQTIALEYGMSLKDSSSFNIQFLEGKPILIDTLSFEKYVEGKPWIAYKQFIEHFLTPLSLMAFKDVRLGRLSSIFLDGVPVDLASSLLPFKSRLNMSLLIHIFAHSATQKKLSNKKLSSKVLAKKFSLTAFKGLIDNLQSVINNMHWNPTKTQWANYLEDNNYGKVSLNHKAELTRKFLKIIKPKTVWDLGANTGFFSRIAASQNCQVISFDSDFGALEQNYQEIAKSSEKNILPLFCDLTNPTPSLGWTNQERESLVNRGPADAILALALVHHLAISNNIPLPYIADLFAKLAKSLIIEFVPKEDSQVQRLLANREDIFNSYNEEGFEMAFKKYFKVKKKVNITESMRVLYLMEK